MNKKIQELFKVENLLSNGFHIEESADGVKVMCNIEAIHAGTTDNFNTYSKEELKKSLRTWTKPYKKPVMTHHNVYTGEPIGRVQKATMSYSDKSKTDTVLLTVVVTDKDAIQKVLDERYLTVSVGCTAKGAECSICGVDIVKEGWCSHRRGETYKGKLCHYILKGIDFEEVSFVNRPADKNAQIVGVINEGFLYDGEKLENLDQPGVNLLNEEEGKECLAIMESTEKEFQTLSEMHQTVHDKYEESPSDDFEKAHEEIVRQMLVAKLEHKIENALDEKLPSELQYEEEKEDKNKSLDEFLSLLAESRRNYESIQQVLIEKDKKIAELNQLIVEKDENFNSNKEQLEQVQEELNGLKGVNQVLNQENVDLATEIRKVLAEQILEYKNILDEEERKTVLDEYCAKSKETLVELLQEQRGKFQGIYEVEDPTLPNKDNIPDIEKNKTEKQEKKLNLLKSLLGGKE